MCEVLGAPLLGVLFLPCTVQINVRVAVRPRLLVTADSTARAQLTPSPRPALGLDRTGPQCSARPRGGAAAVCRRSGPPASVRLRGRGRKCALRERRAGSGSRSRWRAGGRARAAAPGPTMKRDVRILLLGEGRRLGPGRAGVSGPGWGGAERRDLGRRADRAAPRSPGGEDVANTVAGGRGVPRGGKAQRPAPLRPHDPCGPAVLRPRRPRPAPSRPRLPRSHPGRRRSRFPRTSPRRRCPPTSWIIQVARPPARRSAQESASLAGLQRGLLFQKPSRRWRSSRVRLTRYRMSWGYCWARGQGSWPVGGTAAA